MKGDTLEFEYLPSVMTDDTENIDLLPTENVKTVKKKIIKG